MLQARFARTSMDVQLQPANLLLMTALLARQEQAINADKAKLCRMHMHLWPARFAVILHASLFKDHVESQYHMEPMPIAGQMGHLAPELSVQSLALG